MKMKVTFKFIKDMEPTTETNSTVQTMLQPNIENTWETQGQDNKCMPEINQLLRADSLLTFGIDTGSLFSNKRLINNSSTTTDSYVFSSVSQTPDRISQKFFASARPPSFYSIPVSQIDPSDSTLFLGELVLKGTFRGVLNLAENCIESPEIPLMIGGGVIALALLPEMLATTVLVASASFSLWLAATSAQQAWAAWQSRDALGMEKASSDFGVALISLGMMAYCTRFFGFMASAEPVVSTATTVTAATTGAAQSVTKVAPGTTSTFRASLHKAFAALSHSADELAAFFGLSNSGDHLSASK